MKVKVLVFASYREIAGGDFIEVQMPEADGWTVAELRRCISDQYPRLAAGMGSALFAVDEVMARDGSRFGPESSLAAMPPVSGG